MKLVSLERYPWVTQGLRPLIVVMMIMCLNISLVNLARQVNPTWSGLPFLGGMALTTLEAMYSRYVLSQKVQHYDIFFLARYHLVEWGILALLMKLILLASRPQYLLPELWAIWDNPETALTFEFLMMVILGLVAWAITNQTMLNFKDLQDPNESGAAMAELSQNFFIGGILIMVVSGLTQLLLIWQLNFKAMSQQFFSLQRPQVEGVIFNVLLYFALGLVLLSQVNLTRWLMRWQRQGIEVSPGVVNQWVKYSFIFLAVLAGAAFLLPTTYTVGFLASVGLVIVWGIDIITFILQIIFVLISLPILWLFYQLGLGSRPEDLTLPPPPTPVPADMTALTSPHWLEVLQSLGFWVVTIWVVGYLFKTYWHDHPELLDTLRKMQLGQGVWQIVNQWWQTLRQWLRYRPLGQGTMAKHLSEYRIPTVFNSLGLAHYTSPRDQILGYYRNLLEQLDKYNYRRRPDHTPYEYEPQLSQARPTVEAEIHELTETFVQARYSRTAFTPEQAAVAKEQWQRIREAGESS